MSIKNLIHKIFHFESVPKNNVDKHEKSVMDMIRKAIEDRNAPKIRVIFSQLSEVNVERAFSVLDASERNIVLAAIQFKIK